MAKNKRGSHVGRVLSFVIFIVFFVYFYSLLGPEIIIKRDKDYLINYLETEIKQEVTGNLNSLTIRINNNPSRGCVLLENFITSTEDSYRIKIKNEEGDNVSVVRESNTNNVFLLRSNSDNVFFKIYISEEFEELDEEDFPNPPSAIPFTKNGINCNQNTEKLEKGTDYTIHTSIVSEGVLLSLVLDLIDRYKTDYGGLRDDFNFPGGSDFGFGIQLENGTSIQTPDPELDKDIYVQRTPIEYFTQNAERKQGFLIIKVW